MSEDESSILGYTKEKLYDLLPAVYRQKDAKIGKPLEDLISIIATQATMLEKDIGGLYNNWFIETCDEWVTSYIADLVGAKTLSASKSSSNGSLSTIEAISQRAYVANTISYRRRKGTISMLEQLAEDVSQWKAKGVEFFQLLSTTQNVNHIRLTNYGTPDLRDTSTLDLLDTPFDTVAHTLEVRHINSGRGYYNIPNIGIFLWRLQEFPSIDTHAFKKSGKEFTFNPLGYDDIPLFNLPVTEDAPSHLAEEVNVPAPIRRRALYDNFADYYSKDRSIFLTVKYVGETKWQEIAARDIVVCNLSNWHLPEAGKIAVDPELGRIIFSKEAGDVKVNYYYGFSGKIGGGFYNRPENESDFQDKPTPYRVSKKLVFAWNEIPGNPEENSHLKEMLRNDITRYLSEEKQINISLDWVKESLSFNKEDNDRTITMTDGAHSLSIALGTGDESAILRVNNVKIYEFPARKTNEGNIYVSINIDVYESVNEAIVWWKKNRSQNAVFEIIDSEVYDKNIEVNLPAGFTLAIKADQGKRPLLRSLRVQGEKGSRLILDGLWLNNPTSTPVIKIHPGDLESLTIRHCTLVPGRNTQKNKVSLGIKSYIRRQLCVWSDIKTDTSNKHSKNLAGFLNRKLNLDWVNEKAVFQKKTGSDGEYITLTIDVNSLRIDLEDAESAETSAFLSVKDEQEVWKKVYEFTVLTEKNGKKVMYLAGGNDDLEVTLNRTISGRINILDSLLFTWERILSKTQKDDKRFLRNFLKDNFYLLWLSEKTPFTGNANKITAEYKSKSESHSLTFTRENNKVILNIDGDDVYEFIARQNRVYIQSDAELSVTDSIIDGKGSNEAISCRSATIQNTTVFGKTTVDELKLASNTIFTDTVESKITQQGCVRFSYVTLDSKTPRRYMCQPTEDPDDPESAKIRPYFTSVRYGDPGYAQLRTGVDAKIFKGADNSAEMGVCNHLYQPQRISDLKSVLDEYLRFGLEAGVFLVT